MLNIVCLLIGLLCFHNVFPAAGRSNKIVNGVRVEEGEFPYVVSLQYQLREPYCGGSLLSLSWIMTACHCVTNLPTDLQYRNHSEMIAIGGNVDITKGGQNQERGIKRFIKHPHCEKTNNTGIKNDYGLCETVKPFKPGPNVEFMRVFSWNRIELRLKTDELVRNNYKCQVVGWGNQNNTKDDNGNYNNKSKVLMKLDVYLSDHHKCNHDICFNFIKNITMCARDYVVSNGHVCAYGTNKGDACTGDSGGPLSCNGSVYGLVSWGPYCGQDIGPTMYSRLDNTEFFNMIRYLALARNTCSVIRSCITILTISAIFSFFSCK